MHFICFIHSFIVLLHILWPGPPPSVLPEMILSPVTLLGSSLIAVPESSCPPGSVISNHHEITLLGPRHVARGTCWDAGWHTGTCPRHRPPGPHGLMALSLYQLSDQSRKYILGNLGLRIWATQHASEIPLRNSSDIPTRHTQTAICRYVLAVLCR